MTVLRRLLLRLDAVPLHRLLLAALAVRVAWIVACPNVPYSDQAVYHYEGQMLALGRGYIDIDGRLTNFYPVGYPALLGAAYAVFGSRYFVAYALNVALAAVSMTGSYQLGRLLFGERAGRVAALLVAIHPTFIMLTTALASENPFFALLPWTLWLLVRLAREPRARWLGLAAGAGIAAMVYVRPPALLLLSCPVVFGLVERRPARAWIVDTLLVGAVAFALLAPWGVRNERVFDRFSITSFNAGLNLYFGNNPNSAGDWMDDLPEDVADLSQPEQDRALTRKAVGYIRAHPARYVVLSLNRLQVSMRSDTIAPVWDHVGIIKRFGKRAIGAFKVVCSLAHWGLLLGLGATLWRVGRRGLARADLELAWAGALSAVPFVLIVGGNRYMLPLMVLVCVWMASFVRPDDPWKMGLADASE
jgi:4-amino-4-deoxy-L-arabinose transferase-like glycosyltransferase